MPSSKVNGAAEIILENGHTITGATRRAGNLWTVQARDDMFNRRESGESWESICLDYPKRSRHAMQQQYSMMKKQRAMADGTWTSNRRGRKRKMPERWPGMTPRSQSQYVDNMDEDGMSDDDSMLGDESQELDEIDALDGLSPPPSAPEDASVTEPPPPISQSATDQITRALRSKDLPFPNLPVSIPTSSFSPVNAPKPPNPPSVKKPAAADRDANGIPQPKRRRTSTEVPKLEVGEPESTIPDEFKISDVMFDREELLEFFTKGAEKARSATEAYNKEAAEMRSAYGGALGRAHARHKDAEDRLREIRRDLGDAMRLKEQDFMDQTEATKHEHGRELRELRAKLEGERRQGEAAYAKQIDALAKSKAALEKTVRALRHEREEADRRQGRDGDVAMRDEQPVVAAVAAAAADTATTAAAEEVGRLHVAISTVRAQLASKEQELARTQAGLGGRVNSLAGLQGPVERAVEELLQDFDVLGTLITRLNTDLDDMSQKAIVRAMDGIKKQSEKATQTLKLAKDASGAVSKGIADLASQLPGTPSGRAHHPQEPSSNLTNGAGVPPAGPDGDATTFSLPARGGAIAAA